MAIIDKIEQSELVEETLKYWFKGNEHIRTPFPDYIREELEKVTVPKFESWLNGLNDKAKDEVNDVIISEKLEELLFDSAIHLVATEDEKITIQYPFLPRLDDQINDAEGKISKITDRAIIKEGDHAFLEVTFVNDEGTKSKTKFELPL